MKLFSSLRFRLILLVLLAVIPALVITYYSGRVQIDQAREKTVEDAFRFTRLVASYQSNYTRNTQQFLQFLAHDDQVSAPQTCRAFLDRLNQSYPIYASLIVVNPDGQVICASVPLPKPVNVSDRGYFQQAVSQNRPVIGEIIQDRLTGQTIQPIAVPLPFREMQKNGALVAGLDIDQFVTFAQNINLPPESAILILGSDGTIFRRYPAAEGWVGKQFPGSTLVDAIVKNQQEGSAEVPGVDGIARLYAFTPLESPGGTPLYVSIGIPTEVAYARPNQLLRTNLILLTLAALLAVGAAWFGGDVLFLRVVSLTAERDAAENRLREANTQLEARVAERTNELAQANAQLEIELSERQRMVEALHQRGEELNRLLARLKQSNSDLQDFAFVASHDLQEPLRKIQAFGDRLARYTEQLGPEGTSYVERMSRSANRMQAMINALLSYSRIHSQGSAFTPTNLNKVLEAVISDLEIQIQETGGTVVVDPLPTLMADPQQMHQLFQNLIANALKFHRPEVPPNVHVVYSPNGSTQDALIGVEDNGIGFEIKYLDRIFQPFQRLQSRESFEGSGIGLALCRKIVARHNGHITATSTPGAGSRFMVSLPFQQKLTNLEEQPND